jgi:hypothetical protein
MVKEGRDLPRQLAGVDGLGDVTLATRSEGLLVVAFHREGGQGDDRDSESTAEAAQDSPARRASTLPEETTSLLKIDDPHYSPPPELRKLGFIA